MIKINIFSLRTAHTWGHCMPCRGAKPLGPHPGICRQGCPLSLCFRSPRAFSLLAAALMRPAPIVNCVLRRTVSAQSTKLQSVGFWSKTIISTQWAVFAPERGREGGGSQALSIVRQRRRPTGSLQDARNCQLFPDNSLVVHVVLFNRCSPANYDDGRLVVAIFFYQVLT